DYVFFYTEDKNAKKDMDSLNYPNDGNINASEPKTPKATVEKMEQFLIKAVFPKIEYLKVVNGTELDPSKLSELGIANIESIGNENIYIEKNGKYYISKVGNTEDYALGEWDFAKYPEGINPIAAVEPAVAEVVSNKKGVFDALTQYGWSLDPVSSGISKTFAGIAEAGSVSNGERTLSADFDSKERYLAVTDNKASTGGKVIPETEIDLRDYGYDAEGFAKAAKAFNEKVEVYVLNQREASNAPPTPNPDRDYLQSIIDGDVDPLIVDMDAVIALAEKYDGDAEITPLLDQALEVINQAEQEAAKGI
ncbi:MAG TPA: hypothetical protein PLQ39_13635, partial [Acinetobacter sp.]|nr:hypothetical protein [Acinetobacter sp.]